MAKEIRYRVIKTNPCLDMLELKAEIARRNGKKNSAVDCVENKNLGKLSRSIKVVQTSAENQNQANGKLKTFRQNCKNSTAHSNLNAENTVKSRKLIKTNPNIGGLKTNTNHKASNLVKSNSCVGYSKHPRLDKRASQPVKVEFYIEDDEEVQHKHDETIDFPSAVSKSKTCIDFSKYRIHEKEKEAVKVSASADNLKYKQTEVASHAASPISDYDNLHNLLYDSPRNCTEVTLDEGRSRNEHTEKPNSAVTDTGYDNIKNVARLRLNSDAAELPKGCMGQVPKTNSNKKQTEYNSELTRANSCSGQLTNGFVSQIPKLNSDKKPNENSSPLVRSESIPAHFLKGSVISKMELNKKGNGNIGQMVRNDSGSAQLLDKFVNHVAKIDATEKPNGYIDQLVKADFSATHFPKEYIGLIPKMNSSKKPNGYIDWLARDGSISDHSRHADFEKSGPKVIMSPKFDYLKLGKIIFECQEFLTSQRGKYDFNSNVLMEIHVIIC